MSEASAPHCSECKQPEYACACHEAICMYCGCALGGDVVAWDRDVCFECYGERQD